jgi:hypothetical protein
MATWVMTTNAASHSASISHKAMANAPKMFQKNLQLRSAKQAKPTASRHVKTLARGGQAGELHEADHVADDGGGEQAGLRRRVGEVKANDSSQAKAERLLAGSANDWDSAGSQLRWQLARAWSRIEPKLR